MERLRPAIIAFAFAVCLVAAPPTSLPGDGGEYLAVALNFAELKGAAIAPEDVRRHMLVGAEHQPGIEEIDTTVYMREGPGGQLDFLHFWLYPLLAAPGVWVAWLAGVSPVHAFALLNITLMVTAFAVALPRIGMAASVFIFTSPIIWWLDKVHTEPYTFALLAIALVLLRERPWWSLVAAGAAASQNPVAYAMFGLVLAGSLLADLRLLRDRRWLAGAAGGAALSLLPVAYFWLRYGRPFLISDTTAEGTPALAEILAPLLDPNIGLLANFPFLAIVVVGALVVVAVKRPRDLIAPDMLVAGVAAVVFLLGFARNTNYQHGATPSLSRYGLWLIPLAIPLLRAAAVSAGARWTKPLWGVAALSALASVVAFHPSVPEASRRPTWAASYLWTTHPGWQNPLPEVFAETMRFREGTFVPAATPGCEKILLGARDPNGAWPWPCYPVDVPELCLQTFCYANRRNAGYEFVRAPGRASGTGRQIPGDTWPADVEPHVRRLYDRWAWWSMSAELEAATVRQSENVHASEWTAEGRALILMRGIRPMARLFLRPPAQTTALLIDLHTGDVIERLDYRGPAFEPWYLDVPEGYEFLALALTYPQR